MLKQLMYLSILFSLILFNGVKNTESAENLPVNTEQTVTTTGNITQGSFGSDGAIRYWGYPAQKHPLPWYYVPQHPWLAFQGWNGMHSDSFSSGVSNNPGPLGIAPLIRAQSLGAIGGECATMTFDPRGFLYSVSAGFASMNLIAFEPYSLDPIAVHPLPRRESSRLPLDIDAIMNDTSGGAYFHADQQFHPIIAGADRHIRIYQLTGYEEMNETLYEWTVVEDYDTNDHLEQYRFVDEKGAGRLPRLTDAIPDWDGNLWFTCREGIIGIIDRDSRKIASIKLAGNEEIQNSLSVAEDGVYLVSDFALYRFERDSLSGVPTYTWREEYGRGTVLKPGSLTVGSGTTPTLLGSDLVAIADNADEQSNLLVYLRRDEVVGDRLVCKVPLFAQYESVAENSFIGYDNSIIVMNNYGYQGPFRNNVTAPGITRIDVRQDRSGCDVIWTSDEAMQTTLPRLSTDNGLIYFYTREPVPGRPNAKAWYFVMLDFETGRTINKILAGTGERMNSNWGQIYLGPNGHAYMGVLNGIISLSDR